MPLSLPRDTRPQNRFSQEQRRPHGRGDETAYETRAAKTSVSIPAAFKNLPKDVWLDSAISPHFNFNKPLEVSDSHLSIPNRRGSAVINILERYRTHWTWRPYKSLTALLRSSDSQPLLDHLFHSSYTPEPAVPRLIMRAQCRRPQIQEVCVPGGC
jgi:hypothetical protein